MITYLLIGLWVSSVFGTPVHTQNFKSTPLVYYTPPSQYLQGNVYPFVQYPNESPAYGKALQSIQSPNEILFYPNPAIIPQQQVVVNSQPGNAAVNRFTAPPNGLVDAIYAWFSENNVSLPEDPTKNEASPEKLNSRDEEKNESGEKIAGEAEFLAEADKNPNLNFPKKSFNPKYNPGQRFYILNGQPQFYGNYQPVLPRLQPVIPQLLTRSAIPAEPQNILFLQPQSEIQQPNLNLKSSPTQETTNQNVVLIQDQIQANIKPVRYHNPKLEPQNYVLLRENQQRESASPAQIQVQSVVPTYSRQHLLIGRLLPQSQDIKQQQLSQNPIQQTHYVPVEVVPPQVPQFQSSLPVYQNHDLPQQEVNQQPQLAFIHIPIDRNVQPPQYITAKAQPVPALQQPTSGKQILYLSETHQPNIHQRVETENQIQQQSIPDKQSDTNSDLAPGIAALEFARYIASRQGELYSDTVVIDAKTEDENKEENDSEEIQADLPQEPSMAQAQPGGIALAGPGGVAATAPRGTALVGEKGLAIASPHATAVAGPNPSKEDKNKRS